MKGRGGREGEARKAECLKRERERMTRGAGLREQHRATWGSEGGTHGERERERDERFGVSSWQDNLRQATDSELRAQLV